MRGRTSAAGRWSCATSTRRGNTYSPAARPSPSLPPAHRRQRPCWIRCARRSRARGSRCRSATPTATTSRRLSTLCKSCIPTNECAGDSHVFHPKAARCTECIVIVDVCRPSERSQETTNVTQCHRSPWRSTVTGLTNCARRPISSKANQQHKLKRNRLMQPSRDRKQQQNSNAANNGPPHQTESPYLHGHRAHSSVAAPCGRCLT